MTKPSTSDIQSNDISSNWNEDSSDVENPKTKGGEPDSPPTTDTPASTGAEPGTMATTFADFALLNGTTGENDRRPLDPAERDKFRAQIADHLGVATKYVDVRTLNSSQQTSRAKGESLSAMYLLNDPPSDWIFIGRVTADAAQYAAITRALGSALAKFCSLAAIVGEKPSWRLLRVYYRNDRKALAERLATFLAGNPGDIAEFPSNVEPWVVSAGPVTENPKAASIEAQNSFIEDEEVDRICDDWRRKSNLILQGPPGVGKTFVLRHLAARLMGGFDEARFSLVQFHQSSSYEDFVRGWRPQDGKEGFVLADGEFVKFCERARADQDRIYVFAIDEINRANMSKVFGELLMLLENGKRSSGYAVHLAYRRPDGDERFWVPPNVHVVGTMNTADRSLAIVDTAMRRRFAFHKLSPRFDSPRFENLLASRKVNPKIIYLIKERLGKLNEIISKDKRSLGEGFVIGHSFFCPQTDIIGSSFGWYKSIITSEIGPLLEEYWFDDPEVARKHIDMLEAPPGFDLNEEEPVSVLVDDALEPSGEEGGDGDDEDDGADQ